MTKKYSIVEVKKDDCVFRMLDGFESAFYCKHDMRWFENKKECVGCKYKDSGETKEQIVKKVNQVLFTEFNANKKIVINNLAIKIVEFLGINKE